MINSIEISGFKSIVNETIPLGDLTLLCGLNNSGKSSVIQALRMFYNSYEKNAPLLPFHGSVNELKSKLANPRDPIKITTHLASGNVENFVLHDNTFERPKYSPVISYLSADRWGPKVILPVDRKIAELPTLGDHGEYVFGFLEALGTSLIPDKLHHQKSEGATLSFEIIGWLEEIAPGIKLTYTIDEKRDLSYVEYNSFRPTNVGFGISYCLPILALILGVCAESPSQGWINETGKIWAEEKAKRGITVLIENPEAHLHPKGQTALGKLLAIASSIGVQFIVETQSDHLMDGIRIAIKDKLIQHDKVVFHYLSKSTEGVTAFTSPTVNQNGKLSFWPDGFFDQTLINRAELAS